MVLTAKEIEEHAYRLIAIEEGELGTEYQIFQCTKPGCAHRKIEEETHED